MTDAVETSKLRLYSMGVVVEDKPEYVDIVMVSPVEVLNIQPEGNMKSAKKTYKGQKSGVNISTFNTQHESTNYLKAKWIPFGHSNRITAPDVCAGETVILFKYADVDEYYWTTIFREPSLRRLETVQYAWSNVSGGASEVSFDKETSYWFEVSTKHKYITLKTANNDGEVARYEMTLDTANGQFKLMDSNGNLALLDSSSGTWLYQNQAGKSITVHPGGVDIVGDTRVIGAFSVTGPAEMAAGLQVQGPSKLGGGGEVTGSIVVSGQGQFGGQVIAPNIP